MAREERSRFGGWGWIFLLAVAAVVAVRLLGPGGRPAVDRRGPSSLAPPPGAPSSFVGGRALLADGSPAEGAEVEAVFEPGRGAAPVSLRSPPVGADGKFSLAGAPAKWITIVVRARRGPLTTEIDLGEATGPLTVDLRLPSTFAVSGIVIADEDGRPLTGMEVRVGDLTARTDPLGRFSIGGIPPPPPRRDPPDLVVFGAGRKILRRALPLDGRNDDLLLRVERE